MNLEDAAGRAVEAAMSAGATDAEAWAEESTSRRVRVYAGEVGRQSPGSKLASYAPRPGAGDFGRSSQARSAAPSVTSERAIAAGSNQ